MLTEDELEQIINDYILLIGTMNGRWKNPLKD